MFRLGLTYSYSCQIKSLDMLQLELTYAIDIKLLQSMAMFRLELTYNRQVCGECNVFNSKFNRKL